MKLTIFWQVSNVVDSNYMQWLKWASLLIKAAETNVLIAIAFAIPYFQLIFMKLQRIDSQLRANGSINANPIQIYVS